MADRKNPKYLQLELPLVSASARVSKPSTPPAEPRPVARPGLRVIQGEGRRQQEKLKSRDSVVRVLLEAGADLLLRRISSERAEEIEGKVDRILRLFDQVDQIPALMPVLERHLRDLESLMTQTRDSRQQRKAGVNGRMSASDV